MIQQPDIVMPTSVEMPHAELITSANGVKIYKLSADDFEVVRFTFVFRAGTSMQHKPFVASTTLNMLGEGSSRMTSQQIADELDFYGSYFDVNIDRDYSYVSFCSLSKFFDKTASVAREILLDPIFPERELATYCMKRKQSLTIERRKLDVQSRELFAQSLFGVDHPYGRSASEDEYDRLTREDVVAMYRELYTSDNCFVVCSGRIDDDVLTTLKQLVESLPKGNVSTPQFPECVINYHVRRDVEGALQSSIRIGRLLFPRTHPDFVGMQVVAAVLGGYFGSRLMANLREQHGYTYGINSAMVNFENEGYLAIATQVARECCDEALKEIYFEIECLRNELVSEDELQMVKNVMIGEILRILDGPFGIADVTIENIMCGMDNGATERSVEQIVAITPEEVRSLARKYLQREKLVEVVVG
jgi:predicted Zn-dependent peptidase